MKKIFLSALCVFSSLWLLAQCNSFYYLQANKKITMNLINKKGKETGKYIYKVGDIKMDGGTATSVVESEILDDKGKKIGGSVANFKCTNGVYMADMKVLMPPQQAGQANEMKANSSFFLEYPATMSVGDALKNGSMKADLVGENGVPMGIEMAVTDRKVEGEETITTPAGTWKCYRIHLNNKLRTIIAGLGIPINIATTEWFAPGFGVVRTESKWGVTEIASIE